MQQTEYADGNRRKALVLCNDPERQFELVALAKACQYEVAEPYDAAYPAGVDCLIADLRSESDHIPQPIFKMVRYLADHQSTALIWVNMDMLEAVYAAFPNGHAHFLIDAHDAEAVPILTGVIGQKRMNTVRDNARDTQFNALHRISDELAGFARTLARIAEQDADGNVGVSDKPVSFRPAPAALFEPFATTGSDDGSAPSATTVREIIKLRRLRDSYFASDLFADPAWDILLDLIGAQLEKRPVSVSSLCIAAAVPPTTALRWITAMTESGMLVRENDPTDARRVFIGLSVETANSLLQYLAEIKRRSAQVV